MLNNGLPLGVPDLSHAGQPDVASFTQTALLQAAGITPGGAGCVDDLAGESTPLLELGVIIVAIPPQLHILAVSGVDEDGNRVCIPWHAVARIRPVAFPPESRLGVSSHRG